MSESSPTQEAPSPATTAFAAVVVGLVFAGLDLASSMFHVGGPTPSLGLRLALLAILAGVGGLVGVALAALVALVGRRQRLVWFVTPAALAFLLGRYLAEGKRAATMPLAAHWDAILFALTAVAAFTLPRLARRSARIERVWAVGLVVVGLGLYGAASFVQRGRYEEVRVVVVLLAACMFHAWLAVRLGRIGGRFATLVVVIALSGLLVGGVAATRRQAAVDWATSRTTAVPFWAGLSRRIGLGAREPAHAAVIELPPFFGTKLAADSRARLGAVDGVVIVTIDALRADVVGKVVDGTPITPFLDELGRRGLVFERAYTPAPLSQIALLSMFSGLYPSQVAGHTRGLNGMPLVTKRLGAAGVETRGCYPRAVFSVVEAGFDRYELDFGTSTLHTWIDLPPPEAFGKLAPERGGRFFSYWHIFAPHSPYNHAPKQYDLGEGDWLDYLEEVRFADDQVRGVVTHFEEAGLLDRMLLVVSADHGEEFYEHGGTCHGSQVWEEVARVPLVVVGPGVRQGRSTAVVSLVDIAPTLEHVFDLPDAGRPAYVGRSWVPELVGQPDEERLDAVLVETLPFGPGLKNVNAALIGARWKLVWDQRLDRRYLFDLAQDPLERDNLAERQPDRTRDELARLRGFRQLSGEFRPSVFAGIDSATQIVERGEFLNRFDLYSHLQRKPDVPVSVLQKHIVDYGYGGNRLVTVGVAGAYEKTDDPRIRHALTVMLANRGLPDPAGIERVCAAWDELESADLVAALLNYLMNHEDRRFLDRELPPAVRGDLLAELARDFYRFKLIGSPPDRDLIVRGVGSTSPYVVRHAAWYAYVSRIQGLPPELFAAHAAMDEPRARAALVAALGGQQGDPRVPAFLRARVLDGVYAEAIEAMTAIGVSRDEGADFAAVALADPLVAARATGFTMIDRYFGELTAKEAECPLTLPESPGGRVLGVYLRFTFRTLNSPVLQLTIGDWTSPPIAEANEDDRLPTLIWIPPHVRGDVARLKLLAGKPAHVQFGGFVALAAPDRPLYTTERDRRERW